ncbi:hypothetical protein [uncultured Sphingomonas sp.]|uniref:hypothetical protein n=1 Tax=uncultured Sphingomonas sp. TaxID=158754 RepID=UPI0037486049
MVWQRCCRYIADERTAQRSFRRRIYKCPSSSLRPGAARQTHDGHAADAAKEKRAAMTRFIKSSFAWQFAGGFVLGAMGMMAAHVTQPEMPTNAYAANAAHAAH